MNLLLLVLLAGYLYGAWRFMKGANRFYQSDKALPLALAWPVLLLVSPDFRRNFNRALKP
ncbi:hypothetical protein [Candidatus Cyanaurora vandensis]|uniref:hypothetical protein n=1 Tax=Candidatus Cyanaurora vandensis TaxID=2714958 RepID=UPI00257E8B2A|nr:hypothetical protein [Candidatus Cyanaurora vandensis]